MTEQTVDLKAILDKIAHLKALHERPGTEHEAQVAAGMITKLMLRYNLSQAQVDGAGVEVTMRGAEAFMYALRRQRGYARMLIHVIARHNFGETVYTPNSDRITIFAREYNRDAIIELYEYLLPIMERLAREGYAVYEREFVAGDYIWTKPVSKSTWQTGFLHGFCSGLSERLEEQRIWMEQQQNSGSAIVMLTDEVKDAMTTYFGTARLGKGRSARVNQNGYAAGRQAGRTTNLADRMAS